MIISSAKAPQQETDWTDSLVSLFCVCICNFIVHEHSIVPSRVLTKPPLIVDLQGAAKTASLRHGAFIPLSVPVIATNVAMLFTPCLNGAD